MNIWTLQEDGWEYTQDGTQRRKRRADGSMDVESVCNYDKLTQDQFIEDCDVNVIMARYMKTGEMPPINGRTGVYGDFTELPSYQEALHTLTKANDMFMDIPAHIRLRFENDPQKLMDYLADSKNDEEAIKLGLKVRKEAPIDPNKGVIDAVNSLGEKIAKNSKRRSDDSIDA